MAHSPFAGLIISRSLSVAPSDEAIVVVVSLLVRLCSNMHPLALSSKDAEYFSLLVPGAAEPMRYVRIELGHLPSSENQIMITQHKTHPPGKDVKPLVALVGL